MSGEALTTHASLTVDLVLKFLCRHLDNGDVPVREFVDEFRAAGAGDLGRFRLGELATRVPQQSSCYTHLSHKLARRKAERREGPVRNVESYRGHFFGPFQYQDTAALA